MANKGHGPFRQENEVYMWDGQKWMLIGYTTYRCVYIMRKWFSKKFISGKNLDKKKCFAIVRFR